MNWKRASLKKDWFIKYDRKDSRIRNRYAMESREIIEDLQVWAWTGSKGGHLYRRDNWKKSRRRMSHSSVKRMDMRRKSRTKYGFKNKMLINESSRRKPSMNKRRPFIMYWFIVFIPWNSWMIVIMILLVEWEIWNAKKAFYQFSFQHWSRRRGIDE